MALRSMTPVSAVVSAEADSAAKWARSVFSSSSAVETDPRRVEPVMQVGADAWEAEWTAGAWGCLP